MAFKIRWIAFGALLLASTLAAADGGAAGGVDAPGATPTALSAGRPILQSTVMEIGRYGAAPLRWRGRDLAWILPAAGTAVLLHQHDVRIQSALAGPAARQGWLDDSMPMVSTVGEGWSEATLALLGWGLGSQGFSDASAEALQALAVAGVYAQVLKVAAWSNRPSQDATAHRYFAYDQSTQGMPSGHSFSAFALAEVYGDHYGRAWTYPFALLIAYSRVYNNAHWSSDVFVGSLLGIAAGRLVRADTRREGPPRFRWSVQPAEGGALVAATARF